MNLKKRASRSIALALVGVTTLVPMIGTVSAMENDLSSGIEQKNINEDIKRSVVNSYYWKVYDKKKSKSPVFKGSKVRYDDYTASRNGERFTSSAGFLVSDTPTVSGSIQLAKAAIAGSVNVTLPSTQKFYLKSVTSSSLNKGDKVTAYYQKREYKHTVYQQKWLMYSNGTTKPTTQKATAYVHEPYMPNITLQYSRKSRAIYKEEVYEYENGAYILKDVENY